MKKTIQKAAFTSCLIALGLTTKAQTQKGSTLGGALYQSEFGYSVNMPNSNTLVVGADAANSNEGHAKVYSYNGSGWIQKGQTLNGTNSDHFGWSVNMPDTNTLVVGAKDGNASGGYVKVYRYNNSTWIQKGQTLNGVSDMFAGDDYLGWSVNMPDSNTLAVGAIGSDYVNVFRWNGSTWVQKGDTLKGIDGGYFGNSVNMPDSNTLIVGAPYTGSGYLTVYSYNGTTWVQKGDTLKGNATSDNFGFSVNMPDSNTLIVGAPGAGYTEVYQWNGNAWVQKGSTLTGATGSEFGNSVNMPDSNTLIIGAPDANNSTGYTQVYQWNGGTWVQEGQTLNGAASFEDFGHSVNMPDNNTLIVGAPYSDYGYVKVYSFSPNGILKLKDNTSITVYPNPTSSSLTITTGKVYEELNIKVTDITGRVIATKQVSGQQKVALSIKGAKGIYFVHISNKAGKTTVAKIVKE